MGEHGKKNNVVDLGNSPWELVSDPQLLSAHVNVVKVSPLPSRACANACLERLRCRECGNGFLKLVDFNCSGHCAALLGRCRECSQDLFGFFSESQLLTIPIIMAKGSPREYLDESDNQVCPDCQSALTADLPDHTRWRQIAPGAFHCQACHREINVMFWDRPMRYFSYMFDIAQSVQSTSPPATLILAVAALEAYLQKAFVLQSHLNRTLVEQRKVGFLNVQEARKIYKGGMDIDIKDTVSEETWSSVGRAIRLRHCFVHNSGLRKKDYAKIDLTSCDVSNLMQSVKDLAEAVDKCLTKNCLI